MVSVSQHLSDGGLQQGQERLGQPRVPRRSTHELSLKPAILQYCAKGLEVGTLFWFKTKDG